MKSSGSFLGILVVLSTLCFLSTLSAFISTAHAQIGAVAPPSEFAQLMSRASIYDQQNQTAGIARSIYAQALQKAQTDDERAQAQLGIARNTLVRPPDSRPDDAGVAKNAEFLKVLALPNAPATLKADAMLGAAQVQAEIGRFESAVGLLAQVEAMPDATPAQKLTAQYWRAQALIELKQFDQATAALTSYLTTATLDKDGKIQGWQHLAQIYLAQNNGGQAKEVLAKTVEFPGLSDDQIADTHIANGKFLSTKSFQAAAREEYSKVAILANAAITKNVIARYQIGQTYFAEKNYTAAREIWTQVLEMRGAEKSGAALWKAIGTAHAEEKNYAAARAAYEKWLAVPGLNLNGRVEARELIADSYIQEKDYAAARTALGNIGTGAASASIVHLRMQFGIANVYRQEQDFENATKTYISILKAINDYFVGNGRKTSDHYTAESWVEEAATAMAKEPASMAAAYTLYEAMEKHFPYDKEKAEANLGMGDILLAQGKRDEAKAKYEKALALRKTYDEGKLAEAKLKTLEEVKAP